MEKSSEKFFSGWDRARCEDLKTEISFFKTRKIFYLYLIEIHQYIAQVSGDINDKEQKIVSYMSEKSILDEKSNKH